ncbi:MAG: toprim domain-containing protein [Microthrixaceae bacterium]
MLFDRVCACRSFCGGRSSIIVESPSKAKTIAGYLGDGYCVEASVGHAATCPATPLTCPSPHKGNRGPGWGSHRQPLRAALRGLAGEKDQVKRLRSLLADADGLYLAPTRTAGARRSRHLEVLNPDVLRRMVFPRVTADAIRAARWRIHGGSTGDSSTPREDERILDRLRLRGQPGALEEGDAAAVRRCASSR